MHVSHLSCAHLATNVMAESETSTANTHLHTTTTSAIPTPAISTPNVSLVRLNPTPYPDKIIDRVTPSRNRLQAPSTRFQGNPLFRRRVSFGSSGNSSSGDESPATRRSRCIPSQQSEGATARQMTYLVNVPNMSCKNTGDTAMCPKTVLMEVCRRRDKEENRPPSPRPANEFENCVQHNKQMKVWDDWVALSNSGVECDIASISYKRVESRNIVESKPKALQPLTSEDLDQDD